MIDMLRNLDLIGRLVRCGELPYKENNLLLTGCHFLSHPKLSTDMKTKLKKAKLAKLKDRLAIVSILKDLDTHCPSWASAIRNYIRTLEGRKKL